MAISPQDTERLVKLLVWIGGVSTTVAGSWIASKIHVYHNDRNAHRDEIKQRVLIPLRDGLAQHFARLAFHLTPVVSVEQGAIRVHEKVRVTEAPTEEGEVLVAAFPSASVFGPLDPALLQDARKNHFRGQMSRVDQFVMSWAGHAGECHSWVSKIAREILAKSGLEAFPNRSLGPRPRPYVMHYRLAVFVYQRLFNIPTRPLLTDETESYWTLNGEDATLALGSKEQVEMLVEELNRLVSSEEANARSLRNKASELQKSFTEVTPELDHAIASRRLHKRCDLVTFF